MRVDGPNRLEPGGVSDPNAPARQAKAPGDEVAQSGGQFLVIQRSYAGYVQKALAGQDVRPQAVEEARRLLRSGQLDTPEAARRAAEAVLSRGI